MRLIIELEALKDCAYDMRYHSKLQGFVYNLIREGQFSGLHSKKGYKPLCFSNIFPPEDMKAGDRRHLIISSPIPNLARAFKESLSSLEVANIGDMSFSIKNVSILEPKIGSSATLTTGTPIVNRIPRENYERYGIKPPKDYSYLYWRREYPFSAFLKQLEENLIKKYREFHDGSAKALEEIPLFSQFLFKKTVCSHTVIDGKEIRLIGSLWDFIFTNLTKEQRRILQFGLDAGFGELNALGFGFMNIAKGKEGM